LAAKYRLPAIYQHSARVKAGGLVSYGPNGFENFRQAATFVGKILKGAKPGDLPVEQPTRFELVINLNTAKVLGLTVPASILARADEVIARSSSSLAARFSLVRLPRLRRRRCQ
jgi:putative ABC transport system substrate-binding protein